MMRGVIALDQGSHASRACLFDESGTLRASAQRAVGTSLPGADRVEQDPQELADSLRNVLRDCLAQAKAFQLLGAGLATQRSSIVCAERGTGRPLSPVLSWQDRRNAGWLEEFRSDEPRIRRITGLPLSPHYGASKMRWCLDHLPEVRRAAEAGTLQLLPLASWLVSQLTGRPPRVDPANASRTLLWDSATLDWSPELLSLFGIERAMLPDCGPTQGDHGRIGMPLPGDGGVALLACTGDQSAVPFFAGTADENAVYVNLGTGAFLQRPLTQRPPHPEPLLGSILRAGSGEALYSLEGTVNGGGSAVSAFIAAGALDEAALWRAVETLPDDQSLPLYVNGVGGLGSPWWQPTVESRFVGSGETLQQFGAVLESIAVMLAANFARMAQHGAPLRRVLVMGGMSRCDWLCRRLAAACGTPVERVTAEATARGAAALAAPALAGGWPSIIGTRFEPAQPQGLAERQAALLALLDATAGGSAKRRNT